jgi:predicted dehydrogenase
MGDPIRIGIVGSRFAAEFHYTAYQRVTGLEVKVVGVTSLTKEHCEHFVEKRGIRVFYSLVLEPMR